MAMTIRQCPFCCSGGPIVTALHVPKGHPPRYAVVCDDCDAQGPPTTTRERAIEDWADREGEAQDLEVLDDQAIEDQVVRRPEVAGRLIGGALLALGVRNLLDSGRSLDEVFHIITTRTPESPGYEGDEDGSDE